MATSPVAVRPVTVTPMALWPEGSARAVAEPNEPEEPASITSALPSSVLKTRSVLPSPLRSSATIVSGDEPEASPLPAAEITGVANPPLNGSRSSALAGALPATLVGEDMEDQRAEDSLEIIAGEDGLDLAFQQEPAEDDPGGLDGPLRGKPVLIDPKPANPWRALRT